MLLAEVRVLRTNALLASYDLTEEADQEGVARAISDSIAETECVVVVDRDEPLGDVVTPNPAPLALPPAEPTEPAP